jgi:hypothetical protein
MTRNLTFLALTLLLAAGCPPSTDDTTSTDDTDVDTDPPISIPDPGTGAADWFAPAGHGTPETAWPVGVVSGDPGYVEGDAAVDTGGAFYVFRAEGSFDLNIAVFGGEEITFVHLHDGQGGVFGDELTPITSTNTSGTWAVQDGNVYVFEVHVDGGGFF